MSSLIFVLMILASLSCMAQVEQSIQVIKTGDEMPIITLNNVENVMGNTLALSELKGKKIIIDFWSKWCSSCIDMMPKIAQLQEKYRDKLTILTVFSDSKEDLSKLREISSTVKYFDLPIVVHDSIMNRLFPHRGVPFYVWIDENGMMKGESGSRSINDKNVHFFIQNGVLHPDIRKPQLINSFVGYLPLRRKVFLGKTYYSGFKKEEMKLKLTDENGGRSDTIQNVTAIMYPDMPLLRIISIMYGKKESEITTIDKNLTYLLKPTKIENMDMWERQTSYSYRIRIDTPDAYSLIPSIGKEDLRRQFGIEGQIRKVYRKVYVLKLFDTSRLKTVKRNSYLETLTENRAGYILLKKANIQILPSAIEERLNSKNSPSNFINVISEIEMNGLVNIELKFDDTLSSLNAVLNKYGLTIDESYYEVELLFLKEVNNSNILN